MGEVEHQSNLVEMKHLVLIVKNGLIEYRMGDRTGSQPVSESDVDCAIAYLIKMIKPDTHEII